MRKNTHMRTHLNRMGEWRPPEDRIQNFSYDLFLVLSHDTWTINIRYEYYYICWCARRKTEIPRRVWRSSSVTSIVVPLCRAAHIPVWNFFLGMNKTTRIREVKTGVWRYAALVLGSYNVLFIWHFRLFCVVMMRGRGRANFSEDTELWVENTISPPNWTRVFVVGTFVCWGWCGGCRGMQIFVWIDIEYVLIKLYIHWNM